IFVKLQCFLGTELESRPSSGIGGHRAQIFNTLLLIGGLFSGQIFHLLLPFTVTKLVTSREISKAVESRNTRERNWQVLTSGTGFNGVSCLLPTLCTVPHHNVFGRIRYNDLWAGRLVLDRRNATASRSS